MNGITIIEEHLCRTVDLPALIGIIFIITLMYGCVIALYSFIYKTNTTGSNIRKFVFVCSIIISILYAAVLVVQVRGYNETHMEYTVIADDTVSFNDFMEKYEIISIDGIEYRVKEK